MIYVAPVISISTVRTDLRQMCRVGGTVAVDERINVRFSIPQGTFPWQPILWALFAEFDSSQTIEFLSFADSCLMATPTTDEFLCLGDIQQMAVSIREKWYNIGCWAQAEVMHRGEWTHAARGIAGRVNRV